MSARPKTVREVLFAAARLIETWGWVQGRSGSCRGGFCAVGAIEHVLLNDGGITTNLWDRVFDKVEPVIGQVGLASWNDEKGRKKTEVVRALRTAAKAC